MSPTRGEPVAVPRKITKAGGVRCGNPLANAGEILIVPVAGGDLLERVSDRERPILHVPPRHAMSRVFERLARMWLLRRALARNAAEYFDRHASAAPSEDR